MANSDRSTTLKAPSGPLSAPELVSSGPVPSSGASSSQSPGEEESAASRLQSPSPIPGSPADRVAASVEADLLDAAEIPRGSEVPSEDGEAIIDYVDPMAALLDPVVDELPTTFVNIVRRRSDGSVITAFKLEFRALATGRVEALRREYTRIVYDKKTHERVSRFKDREFRAQLIIESTVNMDWGSAELARRYNTSDPHKLVEAVLLSGEVERCSAAVYRISGGDGDDDLEAVAGNS